MRRKANQLTNMHIMFNPLCLTHTVKAEISVYELNQWPILQISIQLILSLVIYRVS